MRAKFLTDYSGPYGNFKAGSVDIISLDAYKTLLRGGYIESTDEIPGEVKTAADTKKKPGPTQVVVGMGDFLAALGAATMAEEEE